MAISWDFNSISSGVFIWMIAGICLYTISLVFLIVISFWARKQGCWCSTECFLRILMFFSLCKYILSIIYMSSNNGTLPTNYSQFNKLCHPQNYSGNDHFYDILFKLSDFLSFYCLIIIFYHIISALNLIKHVHLKNTAKLKSFSIFLIFYDLIFRLYACIVSWNSPLCFSSIYITLYSLLFIIYLIWIIFIFISLCGHNPKEMDSKMISLKADYRMVTALGHLDIIGWILLIWFVLTCVYRLINIFITNTDDNTNNIVHNISLWIQWIILPNMLNFVILFYLIPTPAKMGYGGIESSKRSGLKRGEIETSFHSKSIPVSWRRKSSYKNTGQYWNPARDESVSINTRKNRRDLNRHNKGGYQTVGDTREHSWYESINKKDKDIDNDDDDNDKEQTPAFMKIGVYDIPTKKIVVDPVGNKDNKGNDDNGDDNDGNDDDNDDNNKQQSGGWMTKNSNKNKKKNKNKNKNKNKKNKNDNNANSKPKSQIKSIFGNKKSKDKNKNDDDGGQKPRKYTDELL